MKTSLNLADSLFEAARKEAERQGTTISETISRWARAGWKALSSRRKEGARTLKSVDLGGPSTIDLKSRRDWLDALDR